MLPYLRASEITEINTETKWLVDGLWSEGAVGILGGEPKCCKSILSLELAVAVSSGIACLGRFAVKRPGRVLLYAAEDSLEIVKTRLLGITASKDIRLDDCDIQVITVDRLRLDLLEDLQKLDDTVKALSPRLLILDPFVRLHRIDENSSHEVAVILQNLRSMQKRYNVSIILVHHAKKSGSNMRAGQALRGSSEFHAWGDSNLYMRRVQKEQLTLTVEHRAASSLAPIPIALKADGDQMTLEIIDQASRATPIPELTLTDKVAKILAEHPSPMSLNSLRQACKIRTETLCKLLKLMCDNHRIIRNEDGYALNSK